MDPKTHDYQPPGNPAEAPGVQQLSDEEFEAHLRAQGICFGNDGPRLVGYHLHIDPEDRP